MDKDELKQEQIERYLDGLMTEAENAAFEQQLQGSETLREALEEERMVKDAMQRLREQELRAKLKQWRQKAPEPATGPELVTKKRFGWRFWLALGAAGILLFWGYRHLMFDSSPAPEENPKYNEALPDSSKNVTVPDSIAIKEEPIRSITPPKKPSDPLLQRLASVQKLLDSDLGFIKSSTLAQRKISTAENPDSLSLEIRAAIALEKSEFDKALQYVAQLDASKSEVRNIKAQALFGAKQYAKAAEEFRTLVNSTHYGSDAQWNMVMCYFAQYPEGQENYRREIEQVMQGKSKKLQKKVRDWEEEVERAMLSK